MTNEKLNTALYEKMFAEQETYRAWLLSQPPEEILNHTYPLSYLTNRRGTTDWLIRAAALGLFETAPESYIHQSSRKRQAEHLPCRHRQTGAGYHGTAKGGKRFRMDWKNE